MNNPTNILTPRLMLKTGYYEVALELDETDLLFGLFHPAKNHLATLFNDMLLHYVDETSNLPSRCEHNFSKFLFRGQESSVWSLTPSLFRELNDENAWIKREINSLIDFTQIADLCNIQIPSDSCTLRETLHSQLELKSLLNTTNWVTSDIYEIMGFAQHYGLSTRLLDWSHHPLVALYFASISLLLPQSKQHALPSQPQQDGYFSLWILNQDHLIDYSIDITIIETPKSLNKNISNQYGCFSSVKQFPTENTPRTQSIYQKINKPFTPQKRLITDELNQKKKDFLLLKINIPYKSAIDVFRYCDFMGFNAAKLFNNEYGLQKYIKEYSLLKKSP